MYVRVWRYRVPEPSEVAFRAAYCATGAWAELFALGTGYLGTELSRDVDDLAVWVTIDRWVSLDAWELFLSSHGDEYRRLDDLFAGLTDDEVEVVAGIATQ